MIREHGKVGYSLYPGKVGISEENSVFVPEVKIVTEYLTLMDLFVKGVLRYVIFSADEVQEFPTSPYHGQPEEFAIIVTKVGGISESIASAILELPQGKASFILVNLEGSPFEVPKPIPESRRKDTSCNIGWLEWYPADTPEVEKTMMSQGIFDVCYYTHWKHRVSSALEETMKKQDKSFFNHFWFRLREFPEFHTESKLKMIQEFSWEKMKLLYWIYERVLRQKILPEVFQRILKWALVLQGRLTTSTKETEKCNIA